MLKNYVKITFRTLLRDKASFFINIAGLTLGITSCIILFLILNDGASYDKHHTNFDRIYRIVSQSRENGRDTFTEGIPPALPEAFRTDFHAAEHVVFTSYRRSSMITVEQPDGTFKKYEEPKGLVITQPSFFQIFDRKMRIGDAAKSLDEPNEAVISQKWAIKYFQSDENAIGKTIRYEDHDYSIRGVMEDYPSTTDLPFDLMLSYSTSKSSFDAAGWSSVADQDNCYFLLRKGEDIRNLESLLPGFATKYNGEGDDNEAEKKFLIQPLSEVHIDTRFGTYNKKMPPEAKISFFVIGIFLMLMACINFINLTTAEAVRRTKEVGIRKALGSSRFQLITKFTGETFIVTAISVVLSLGIVQLLITPINSFMDMSLALNFGDYRVWSFLLAITVGVSLLSGIYPAFAISKFMPAAVLKGQTNMKDTSGFNLRRALVVIQFFISQLFLIGTIVVVEQMDFMEEQDLGFRKDAIITVPIPERNDDSDKTKMRVLKNEVLRLSNARGASLNYSPPSSAGVLSTGFKILEKGEEFSTQVKQVDGDYLDLFDIKLMAGENLGDLDTMAGFLVNERLVQIAGYTHKEDIIGKEIDFWGRKLPVIGVVKDFNTRSLSKPMEPVILMNDVGGYGSLSIQLKSTDMQATIKQIQTLWEATYPEYIFKYEFLDEQVNNLYRGERKMSKLITVFSSIAIFIGCLGLFGLISFMANQKTKEVGIRKVLGASVGSIVYLFSKEFVKLILIGFLLAAPISALVMNEFLKEFAYRIDLNPAIFLTALGFTFLIALATVGFRSFKAADADPVKSLRSE
jgi:ABC-type antimicrobial peptide transport system permease subunit